MRDTVKKKKKKTVGQANAVGAGSRKAYRRKKTAIVAAITLIYLVIVAAAAVIIDDRHVEITLLGDEEQLAEAGQQYLDPGAEAYLTGNLFGRTARPVELSVENSVDGSSGSFSSPGTSDTSTNLRTFSAFASAAAA